MSHTSYRTLLDRGRKAGLQTRELYQALSSRLPAPGDVPSGQTDGNGYVERVQSDGHRTLQPGCERK